MRIARGELGARADNRGADTISDFAIHFNQMADRNQVMFEGQRDLMRGVSHELRTPVARIRFALELARDSQTESDRQRHLTAIERISASSMS
jgi:two-component system sensor histidine kinase RstB